MAAIQNDHQEKPDALKEPGSNTKYRHTEQFLIPIGKETPPEGKYDIYPSLKAGEDNIRKGFDTLAGVLLDKKFVIIEGYTGVFFDEFKENLEEIFRKKGVSSYWIRTEDLFKDPGLIKKLEEPSLGGNDPLFGTRTDLTLNDFFDRDKLASALPRSDRDINIIIGPGASLAGWNGFLVYLDIPKNEIQFRARAGSITNLGHKHPDDPKVMYKTFYFVDWIVLNRHKKELLDQIGIFVDAQRAGEPVWMTGPSLRDALRFMSRNVFRARPWFEPGAWGGSWIKKNIEGLNTNVRNYAWSFELITPENGLLIESNSLLLEFSFDLLMYQEAEAVLGDCYDRFGTDFPIRFDFLDTFDGGNLSIQCHPRPEYAKTHFGEPFTQEETYYILDCKDDAEVYLGFCHNTKKEVFRNALTGSFTDKKPLEAEKYILKHKANKHDLFLIPYGTVHGSGKNNLVLEISSTPYIFTFKLYDWLRPDLDGKPRPLNIERGMENLYFERKGELVREHLISKPALIDSGKDWQLFHLPTHKSHFYDVKRYLFKTEISIKTNNKCLVMSLVDGSSIELVTLSGHSQRFSFAETFVVPAAAQEIRIINRSAVEATLVLAFVKQLTI